MVDTRKRGMKKETKVTPYVRRTTDRLRKDISLHFAEGKKTVHSLAEYYSVSYVTMWRAVDQLRNEGVLEMSRGRAVTSTAYPEQESGPKPAVSKVARELRRRIEDGTYRARIALPKYRTLSDELGASCSTILDALKHLESLGVCHKERNRWYSGNSDTVRGASIHRAPVRPSVVPVLAKGPFDRYLHFFSSPRTYSFMSALFSELDGNGVMTQLVSSDPELPFGTVRGGPHGRMNYRDFIISDQTRFLGALLLMQRREDSRFEDWLRLSFVPDLPVVWFDMQSTGPARELFTDKQQTRNFYVARFREDLAVRKAVKTLYSLGHRTIGFPNYKKTDLGWYEQRFRLAVEAAKKLSPEIKIISSDDSMMLDEPRTYDSVKKILHGDRVSPEIAQAVRVVGMGEQRREALRWELSGAALSVASVLTKSSVSAVLIPNDYSAGGHLRLFLKCGITVPGELSLLSFDNYYDRRHVPVSTVDFGGGKLGYFTAQIFLRQVPVSTDRKGVISFEPTVVNRGSLGVRSPRELSLDSFLQSCRNTRTVET